jgi:dihydropteroate synthase
MGILNTTPDSFSDGGKFNTEEAALNRIAEMARQGADIIDVGGESTRPGSEPVSVDEELSRTIPVLRRAVKAHPNLLFSIDTTKYEVAKQALNAGAHIINDVSGLKKEPRFADLCASTGAAYICMHSQGDPKTMQENPSYENVVDDVLNELMQAKVELHEKGVDNLIVDPGIGFGKTMEHNLRLITNLPHFLQLGCPILVGASRKSLIGKLLNDRPTEGRLAGTIALHYHCLMQGATILRVHDVQEAVDSVKIFNALQNELTGNQ